MKAGLAYKTYTQWCDEGSRDAVTMRRFGEAVTERGFAKERKNDGVWYLGIGINRQNE